jgi:REP element-mobilizing transposase RayT
MRQPRLKAPASHPVAYYHCISRVVDRQFVLGETEKEQFVSLMREYEMFCGVRVLTFCIMSNHFHLLVEVPQRPTVLPSDEELLQRVEKLSGLAGGGTTRQMLERFRQQGHHKKAEEYREQIFARMWDVSAFMKLLKQRFTQWFNRERGRKGTLWEERFKSVLVEGAGDALATMAAYIDLNPVRAKLVDDPQEYRWCGYAEAMAGKRRAKEGLRIVAAGGESVAPDEVPLSQALAKYRVWLYGQGESNDGVEAQGQPLRAGFSREAVAQVIGEKGRVPLADYLRMRVRYFADGAVLGTKGFVNEVFTTFRERFGEKRKDGARRLRGVENESLHTLRDLRLRPVG